MLDRKRWIRRIFFVMCGVVLLVATPMRGAETEAAKKAAVAESEARLKRDVTELASKELEGRGPTTKGLMFAGDYIAYSFKKSGLKPGNPDGTYFQAFDIPGSVLDEPATLKLIGPNKEEIALKQGAQFDPMGCGGAGKGKDEPVVFVGYGITNTTQKIDDYAGVDVEDKVVIVLRGSLPAANAGGAPPGRNPFNNQASFRTKQVNAETHKAAAILFVNDDASAKEGDDLCDFNFTAINQGAGKIPSFHVKRAVVEKMLKSGADLDLATVEAEMNRDKKPYSVALKGWASSFEVKMRHDQVHLRNVIGVLEGSGALANETVVIGAHYDHLGYGGAGGSLARVKKPTIHPGADDNGSGSTAVMELAHRFGELRNQPDAQNKSYRRLVFMTFSGEELGLLGSAHYCKNPLYPLEKMYAMLNLDMVGRLPIDNDTGKATLLVEGSTTAKSFGSLVETLNKNHGFVLKKSATFPANSDHASFYRKNVPVLFFWTGTHPDYHRPTDTADKINVEGMRRIVDIAEEVAVEFGTSEKKLEYVAGKIEGRTGGGGGDYPRMGFTPDYAAGGEKGLGIAAVDEGTPAAKAGIKAGDIIVELGGKPVTTIETYVEAIRLQKKGDTFELIILRDGKKQTLKVTTDKE